MMKTARTLLLLSFCALALSAPHAARAWEDKPAAYTEAMKNGTGVVPACGQGCPPGMVSTEIPGGAPAFKDCTEAYQYYIHNGFEFILLNMLQYATVYDNAYLETCRTRRRDVMKNMPEEALRIAAEAEAEFAAIGPVMSIMVRERLTPLVPAHCQSNQPAQNEVLAQFEEWRTETTAFAQQKLEEYLQTPNIECGQFIDTKAARIYDTDFTGSPLLGLTAALTHAQYPNSAEAKEALLAYKATADKVRGLDGGESGEENGPETGEAPLPPAP